MGIFYYSIILAKMRLTTTLAKSALLAKQLQIFRFYMFTNEYLLNLFC